MAMHSEGSLCDHTIDTLVERASTLSSLFRAVTQLARLEGKDAHKLGHGALELLRLEPTFEGTNSNMTQSLA